MAKKRKYSRSAGADVKNEMDRFKRGKARSGPGGKGGKVKSRNQAIAIGLSKARKKGKKVPKKRNINAAGAPVELWHFHSTPAGAAEPDERYLAFGKESAIIEVLKNLDKRKVARFG